MFQIDLDDDSNSESFFKGSLCVSKKEGGETFRKITGRKSKARIYTFLLVLFDSPTALFCYHQHNS